MNHREAQHKQQHTRKNRDNSDKPHVAGHTGIRTNDEKNASGKSGSTPTEGGTVKHLPLPCAGEGSSGIVTEMGPPTPPREKPTPCHRRTAKFAALSRA